MAGKWMDADARLSRVSARSPRARAARLGAPRSFAARAEGRLLRMTRDHGYTNSGTALKVKPVTKLGINLPGVVPVKSPKRQAVIQLDPPVGHIQRGHGN